MTQGLYCGTQLVDIEYRYNMYVDIVDTVRVTADKSRYVDIVVSSVTSHHAWHWQQPSENKLCIHELLQSR